MPLPQVTVTGNLAADPELRFTPTGKAVANFTVIASERRLNRDTNEWEDGASCPIRCAVWEEVAEHVAENLRRGSSVVVTGELTQREYETREGEKRYAMDCRVRTVAAQISRSQKVDLTKIQRSGSFDGGQGSPPPADDPWGPSSSGAMAGGGGFADEPPF